MEQVVHRDCGAEVGDAGRQRDRQVRASRARRPPRREPLGEREGILGVGVGRDDRELVAADPGRDVTCPLALHECARDRLKHAVAGLVAVSVIDELEAVEVEHRERERPAVAYRAAALFVQALLEGAVIEKAGEPVGGGLAVKRLQRVGLRQRDRDQRGEALKQPLGVRREAPGLLARDTDAAPQLAVQVHGHRNVAPKARAAVVAAASVLSCNSASSSMRAGRPVLATSVAAPVSSSGSSSGKANGARLPTTSPRPPLKRTTIAAAASSKSVTGAATRSNTALASRSPLALALATDTSRSARSTRASVCKRPIDWALANATDTSAAKRSRRASVSDGKSPAREVMVPTQPHNAPSMCTAALNVSTFGRWRLVELSSFIR